MQEYINEENCTIKNLEHALQHKINIEINKEEMWLSIEAPLKSFLEESFESKLIRKLTLYWKQYKIFNIYYLVKSKKYS